MAKTISKKKLRSVRGGAVATVKARALSAADKALVAGLPSAAQQKFNSLNLQQQNVFIAEVMAEQKARADLKVGAGAAQMSTVMCPW
jgi:hypothetical protein